MLRKSLCFCALILALAFGLTLPAQGVPPEDGPRPFPQRLTLSLTETVQPSFPPGNRIDFADIPVLFEGKLYGLQEIDQLGVDNLYLVYDGEQQLFNTYRGTAEVKRALGGDPAEDCVQLKDGVACTFWSGLNCTGNAIVVPCHNCGLNMPARRSFRSGCVNGATTIACPNAQCLGTCAAFTGAPGVCLNASANFFSGGCTH